jgi:hypothetical protein
MSKILCAMILFAYFSESELKLGFHHDKIGFLCSKAGCDDHCSKTQNNYNCVVTKQFSTTISPCHGGWPLLRLKGGSDRNSKKQEFEKKSFQEQSEPLLVERPPDDAEDAEDEDAEDEGTSLCRPYKLR